MSSHKRLIRSATQKKKNDNYSESDNNIED